MTLAPVVDRVDIGATGEQEAVEAVDQRRRVGVERQVHRQTSGRNEARGVVGEVRVDPGVGEHPREVGDLASVVAAARDTDERWGGDHSDPNDSRRPAGDGPTWRQIVVAWRSHGCVARRTPTVAGGDPTQVAARRSWRRSTSSSTSFAVDADDSAHPGAGLRDPGRRISRPTTPASMPMRCRAIGQHVVDTIAELERSRTNCSTSSPPAPDAAADRDSDGADALTIGVRLAPTPRTVCLNERTARPTHAHTHRASSKGRPLTIRVVIAEDEAIIRMDLRETLEEEGYDVVGRDRARRSSGRAGPRPAARSGDPRRQDARASTVSTQRGIITRREAVRRPDPHRLQSARGDRAGTRRRRPGLPRQAVPEERPDPGDRGRDRPLPRVAQPDRRDRRARRAARGAQADRPRQGPADRRVAA